MDMAAILFSGVEPFEQIVNNPLTEGPMWNMVKLVMWFQKRRHLKITQFYSCIQPRARADNPWGKKFDCNENVLLF